MHCNVFALVFLITHASSVASYPNTPAFLRTEMSSSISNYSLFGVLEARQGCMCVGDTDPGGCCSAALGECCAGMSQKLDK